MKQLFFDLETTGLDPAKHGIHQISGMVVIDGDVKDVFNFKVQPHPGALLNKEALEIGGVTEEVLRNYEPIGKVYAKFTGMLSDHVDKYNKQDKFFLVGYNNASFDNQFLRAWFTHNGDKYFGSWFWSNSLDVMVLASMYLLSQRHTMADFKLRTVAVACGIKLDETKLHDANYDIGLTKRIYDCIAITPKALMPIE